MLCWHCHYHTLKFPNGFQTWFLLDSLSLTQVLFRAWKTTDTFCLTRFMCNEDFFSYKSRKMIVERHFDAQCRIFSDRKSWVLEVGEWAFRHHRQTLVIVHCTGGLGPENAPAQSTSFPKYTCSFLQQTFVKLAQFLIQMRIAECHLPCITKEKWAKYEEKRPHFHSLSKSDKRSLNNSCSGSISFER